MHSAIGEGKHDDLFDFWNCLQYIDRTHVHILKVCNGSLAAAIQLIGQFAQSSVVSFYENATDDSCVFIFFCCLIIGCFKESWRYLVIQPTNGAPSIH